MARARKPRIRIAVLEADSLRFLGYRALFGTEPDLQIVSSTIPGLSSLSVDMVLLGNRNGHNLFDAMAGLKAVRPDLKIIATGSGADDETMLKALAAGAKGYLDEGATPLEFVQATRDRCGSPDACYPYSSSGSPPRRGGSFRQV